ncbi:hypothetical protein [Gordonia sp. (in: high G+C Gram-positive bacteria)]|uniref:hypothetical protein n=1 Tax=Gordonia sp. (in: high G+C Gram-positive bacteria) TaxID=84139 RepID=UPI003C767ACC
MARNRTGSTRSRVIGAGAIGLAVVVLVAASAVSVVADKTTPARLVDGSVEVVAEPGVPDSVLVSRTVFASSSTAVVVAQAANASDVRAAADLARAKRVPVFVLAESTAPAVSTELRRLGVTQAVRIGAATAPVDVPETTDTDLPGDAVSTGSGTLVLLADSDSDTVAAVATAEAGAAEVISMPVADPRSSGEALARMRAKPAMPVRAIGANFGTVEQFKQQLNLARNVQELPGGGQLMFPSRRVVALYGSPGAPELGPLGRQSIPDSIKKAKALAAKYQKFSPVPVVPGFEIIVTVASAEPGPGGNYTSALDVEKIRPWVDAAGKAGVYVTLDLQPGRMNFLKQAKMYRDLLLEPHVGLALDPEWRLKPNQVHLTQIGSVAPAEVNQVSTWLADIVASQNLPQKALVLHQFDADMLGDRSKIDTRRPELSFVIHADGHGVPSVKMETYRRIVAGIPPRTWLGWKNFYTEDKPMFSPRKTMAVDPVPYFISYQ